MQVKQSLNEYLQFCHLYTSQKFVTNNKRAVANWCRLNKHKVDILWQKTSCVLFMSAAKIIIIVGKVLHHYDLHFWRYSFHNVLCFFFVFNVIFDFNEVFLFVVKKEIELDYFAFYKIFTCWPKNVDHIEFSINAFYFCLYYYLVKNGWLRDIH